MSIADQFKKGEISRNELLAMSEKNPSLAPLVTDLLNEELTESELAGIAAAGIENKQDQFLDGTSSRDTMYGGDGDDNMDGQSGSDSMRGGDGDDVMVGGRGNDRLLGDEGDDNLDGGRGRDDMTGGEGNDSLDGGRDNDWLYGGTGDDTLTGGQGSDDFYFTEGNDVVTDFQPGTDTIFIMSESGDGYEVSYDAESGNSTITYAGGTVTVEGVELSSDDIIYGAGVVEGGEVTGGIGSDYLGSGGENPSHLTGQEGDDALISGAGDDTLDGGEGDDTLYSGSGNDILNGGEGDDDLSSGEGNDTLTGGEGNDTFAFATNGGDDVITDFTPGEDKISINVYSTDSQYDISYDPETGNSTITYEGGSITVEGAQITGDDIAMRAFGTSGDDDMRGGVGNDYFRSQGGSDTISGGAGDDVINDRGIVLQGGSDDVAFGGEGNDTYIWTPTLSGSDTFDGGEGHDTLQLDLGDGMSVEDAFNAGTIQIALTDADGNAVAITDNMWRWDGSMNLPEGVSGTVTAANGDVMTFTNVEHINAMVPDQAGDDPYSPDNDGDEPADVIHGTSRDDTITGTTGDDNIESSRGNDAVEGGSGDDNIEGGWDNDHLAGDDGDDDVDGGRGDDTLLGGSGEDYLNGGQGDDILLGGKGDDTMTGGTGNDAFVYRAGDGDDVITDFTPGEDTIQMGGDDTSGYEISYNPETGNSTITYAGGTITVEGVQITADDIEFYGLGTDGDDNVRGGVADDYLLAADGNDTVTAGGGDDTIGGGAGNDLIDGGDGDDMISGGTGNDTITGGAGDDMFVYHAGGGDDVITDFTPGEDTLLLVGVAQGDYTIAYDPETGNSTITYAGGTITVEGAQISGDDISLETWGTEGDDAINGGVGDDFIDGGEGSDTLNGEEGDDFIDGGYEDNAADLISGGAGDDVYVWTPSGDGSDTFNGGSGNDVLLLDLETGVSVHDAVTAGTIQIQLTDSDGNPVNLTDDMWTTDGALTLPDGVTGTITGPDGDVMTFQNLEHIGAYGF